MNFLRWRLLAIQVGLAAFSVRADTDHLSEFLVGGGSEQHVQRIRDVLDQRVRCGSQTGVPKSLCLEVSLLSPIRNSPLGALALKAVSVAKTRGYRPE